MFTKETSKTGTKQRFFEFAFDKYYDAVEVIKKVTIQTAAFRKRLFGYSKSFNSGVHRFYVKCTSVGDCDNDALGIMTDVDACKNKSIFFNDKRIMRSYAWAQYGSLFAVEKVECNEVVQNVTKWQTGDILCLVVDCNKWKIRCLLNEKKVAETAIENESEYWFAVGIRSNKSQYKLIDYVIEAA